MNNLTDSSRTSSFSSSIGSYPDMQGASNDHINISKRQGDPTIDESAATVEKRNPIAAALVKGGKGALGAVGFSAGLIAGIPALGIFLVQEGTKLVGKGVLGGIGGSLGFIGGAVKGEAKEGAKRGFETGSQISNATVGTIVHLVGGLVKAPFTIAGFAGATLARWGFEEKEKEKGKKGLSPFSATGLQFLHLACNRELLFCAEKIKEKTKVDLVDKLNQQLKRELNNKTPLKEYREDLVKLGDKVEKWAAEKNLINNSAAPMFVNETDDTELS